MFNLFTLKLCIRIMKETEINNIFVQEKEIIRRSSSLIVCLMVHLNYKYFYPVGNIRLIGGDTGIFNILLASIIYVYGMVLGPNLINLS